MAYRDEVLVDSPVAYWRLAETSGTTAFDTSGNARDADYINTVTKGQTGPITGDAADAAVLLGSGYVTAPSTGLNIGGAAFTLECWTWQATNAIGPLMEWDTGSGWGLHLWRYPNPTDLMVNAASAVNTTGVSINAANVMPTSSTWYHAVCTWDGSNLRLYVNGSLVAGPTACATASYTNANFYIGFRAPGATSYVGRMDEVAIYASALSAGRISTHYAARSAGGPVRRWNGSAWVDATVKRWTGSAWQIAVTKRWDGSAWK